MTTTLNASNLRQLLLAIVALALVLLRLPATAQDETLLDGIYTTPNQRVKVTETGLEVFSPTSCTELVNILSASEWTLADQASFSLDETGAFSTTWAVLKRGDQALFLAARGSDYCESTLTPAPNVAVSADGAETVEGEALLYTPFCSISASTFYDYELDEEFSAVMLFAVYDLGEGGTATISIDLPMEAGTYGIWEEDEEMVLRFDPEGSVFPAEFDPAAEPTAYNAFAPDYNNWDYESSLGTIEVESLEPFRGTLEFPNWVNESGETLNFSAGFECATVAGADAGEMMGM